jgi:hypothetical protein
MTNEEIAREIAQVIHDRIREQSFVTTWPWDAEIERLRAENDVLYQALAKFMVDPVAIERSRQQLASGEFSTLETLIDGFKKVDGK